MRPTHILFALMLLMAPLGARAQQALPSLDDPCPVPADERWTPQERFVWERVCVGKIADFNVASDYGGHLDPMKPDGWSQSRILRPAFLAAILLKDPYSRALPPAGVTIVGARFVEMIDLDRAELRYQLLLVDSLVENDVRFAMLRSKHPIALARSKVTGNIKMSGLDLDSNLALQGSQFTTLDLNNVHVSGQVNLHNSKVAGDLLMNGLHARSLYMLGGEFAQVDLAAIRVSDLNLYHAKISNLLDINSGRVDGRLLMDEGRFADVNLTALWVGHLLSMRQAHFNEVELNSGHVGGELLLSESEIDHDLSCFNLEVVQHVFMDQVKIGGSLDCESAKFRGDVYLYGGEFKKDIDLTAVEIGGTLELEGVQTTALKLQNAKIGTIPDLADFSPPKLEVDGLTYRNVVAADKFEGWFRKVDHHSSQPYEQLASVVQSQGNGSLATAIRYAGRERERGEASRGMWLWLTALKWVIGYGHHPERSILWALGLVAIGATVLRISGEGPRNGMPYGIAYSFDTLLPIIRLRERHYQIDLQTWARYYFYWHKIMGYVLATFLIAGLSGLTK